ncbi:hypothetical protein [Actinopolyspora saharensis]|uniref:hypothetical protein n=1 Tax=Actinopolyspora saharensis TaxID=995062 RepID=UPI003F67BD1D
MDKLIPQVNTSEELATVKIDDTEGKAFPGINPVLATPGAFLGGIAVSSATVAAFEAGQG